jgi:hypothetical protein
MKSRLHAAFGAIALLCITTFWISTAVSELFLSHSSVAAVKNAILTGMWLLIPAMILTGVSGFVLGRARRGQLIDKKSQRMKMIAANGILVLLPCAFMLASWATAGRLDGDFYKVQALELLAGAVNITLLALNMRDGLRLTGRLTAKRLVR